MTGNLPLQTVLSASRRTDIPAFYMDWFMAGIESGRFVVVNPYNGREKIVPADPAQVHTIVFWSKDMGRFLDGGYGERLVRAGYHLFFHFTINSTNPMLEPCLPPLAERLQQLAALAGRFEARRILWRFDPICFYRIGGGARCNNLADFPRIADAAAACGVSRCVTSFMDIYRKVERRAAAVPDLAFVEPPLEERREIILKMEQQLQKRGITLQICCEKEVLAALPPESTVAAGSCVPNDLFVACDGGRLSVRKDSGQRVAAGCGCRESVDIGDYKRHPCFHNCLFCYANPTPPAGGRGTGG